MSNSPPDSGYPLSPISPQHSKKQVKLKAVSYSSSTIDEEFLRRKLHLDIENLHARGPAEVTLFLPQNQPSIQASTHLIETFNRLDAVWGGESEKSKRA
jgi:hypothetical protein